MRHVLACLLLSASVGFAVPPELTVEPVTITSCTISYLKIKTDAKKLLFTSLNDAIQFTPDDKLVNKMEPQIISDVVGEHEVLVTAIKDNDAKQIRVKVTVVPKPPKPPVTPPVTPPVNPPVVPPDPPVPPTPTAKGEIFVHFVEATYDAVIIRSKLFEDGQPLRKWQADNKHKVEACDINETSKEFATLVAYAKQWVAKGNKLPYLMITRDVVDPTTNKLKTEILLEQSPPDKPGELETLFKKYGK